MDCEFGRVRRFGAWISSVSKSGVSVGREAEAKRRLLKKWERQWALIRWKMSVSLHLWPWHLLQNLFSAHFRLNRELTNGSRELWPFLPSLYPIPQPPFSTSIPMPRSSNQRELSSCLIISQILYSTDRNSKEIQFKSVHLATSEQLENLVNGQHSAKMRFWIIVGRFNNPASPCPPWLWIIPNLL